MNRFLTMTYRLKLRTTPALFQSIGKIFPKCCALPLVQNCAGLAGPSASSSRSASKRWSCRATAAPVSIRLMSVGISCLSNGLRKG
ncbi:hypothetical protein D3C86_2062120 [compost metagenome]